MEGGTWANEKKRLDFGGNPNVHMDPDTGFFL